jgi:putative two-component system response regulator
MDYQLIDMLAAVIEYRHMGPIGHIQRTRAYTRMVLEELRGKCPITEEQIELISSASALHDIGKIAISDAILLKPGRLTREEYEIMKTHTTRGAEIIKKLAAMWNPEHYLYCRDICLYHHERHDGRGYPEGLEGRKIPLHVRAVSIANVYDALTSEQVYRPAYAHKQAMEMIMNGGCGEFDPAFLDVMERISPKLDDKKIGHADRYIPVYTK